MDSIPISHHHYQQSGYEKSMTNPTNLYSVWNNFFLSAGIPASVANEYAVTFSQHRIQIDMLKEITKEILLDMGIKAMGDIIAILRHAKQLCAQDELKGGGGVTKSSVNQILAQPTAHHNNQPPPQTSSISPQSVATMANSNSLTQRTPISSARLSGPTISSSVGGKIQSRLSLSSGALRASLGPQIDSTTTTRNTSSSLTAKPTTTMTIRQRGAAITTDSRPAIAEKTLTVRYSSAAAMEKMAHNMKMVDSSKQHYRSPGSIKSRLDSGGTSSGTSSHRGKELQGTLRNGHYTGTRTVQHFTSNSHKQNNYRRDEATTRPSTSNGRLRSTVFNRLGEGPR